MDTFFEQIVSIKKGGKKIALMLAIWFLALLLCSIIFLFSGVLGGLTVLLIAGVLYGAYKLSGTLNVEYEYIITNSTMDVDKIVNKQSRQRILSFDISKTTRMEAYNDGSLIGVDSNNIVIACNRTDPNAYLLVYEKNGKQMNLVFAPNEKMQSVVAKYLPKFISNSLFK